MSATILECIARLAAAGFYQWGCPDEQSWHWSPPAEGTPPVTYTVEVVITAISADTTFTVPLPDGVQTVEMRVAGVDSLPRQGQWSDWGRYP